jgi:hypothetical protein
MPSTTLWVDQSTHLCRKSQLGVYIARDMSHAGRLADHESLGLRRRGDGLGSCIADAVAE